MIPRIKKLEAKERYKLHVIFDSGEEVIYDVSDDINNTPGFSALKNEIGLFVNFKLDESRTCVFWNDEIDIPSDIIYEYGHKVKDLSE
ncbi:MAG: DUF2442 domain-containing protein [Lachnospiraceae bacterium]|nr:DUF2442 domain-containing protein [Lachnospiraceae bacterium]